MGTGPRALVSGLRERDWARALIASAAVICVLMTLRLFAFPSEPAGDDMTIHMAEVAAMARSIGSGDFDLWNPSANAGFASAYYYQFLPQLGCALLYLALGWLMSLATLFKLTCVAALVALPLATYRALQVLGTRPLAAAAGGFTASLVFSTSGWGSGIDSLFTSGLYTQAFAMALYPLAGAYAVRYLLGGEHLARALVYTLLCGLCHPFIAFALAPAVLCAPWWRVAPRPLARRAAILLAGVLFTSAPLWLPIVVHYDSFGGFPERVAGEEGIRASVFGPGYLRGRYLDHGRLPILSVLALGALALSAVRDRQCRLLLPIAGAGLLYAGWIVAGPLLPKTRGDLLPAIRFLGPMQICLAAAAGAAAVNGAALLIPRARAAAVDARIPVWLPSAAVLLTCAILAAELVRGGFARSMDEVKTIDHHELDRGELEQVIDYLASRPRGRVYADGALGTGSHWWMYLSYVLADRPAVRAYGGASLQSSPNFAALRGSFSLARHWRHFGVRYALVSKDWEVEGKLGTATRAFSTENYEVWTFPSRSLWSPVTALERVARADRDTRAELGVHWMDATGVDDTGVVIYGGAAAGPLARPEDVTIREVREERAYHRAVIDVGGERPALVRLAVSYHPGWRADIDGEAVDIVEISPALMAAVVPPGRHVVRFEFSRPWWTWIGWALLVLAGVVALWRSRRRAGARVAAVVAVGSCLAAGAPEASAQPSHAPADAAFAPGGAAVISTPSGVWIRDRGAPSFRYTCPAAAGTEAGAFEPRVAASADRVLVAGYRGLRAGDACHLEPLALLDPAGRPATTRWIESIAIDARGRLWAATADGTRANDVYRGAGDHLESVGLRSQTLWFLSALPAPSDPSVVYASGYQVAPPSAVLQVSSDGGEHFAPAAAAGLRLGRSRRSRVAAIDPADPDVAYVIAESVVEPRGDVLYRTADRGAGFEPLLSPGATITGAVATPGALWVSAAGPCPGPGRNGPGCLFRVDARGARAIAGPRLSCLLTGDRGELLGCRADAASSGVALVAIDGAGALRPALYTRELAPPCPAIAERCAADWARACRRLGADCDPPQAERPDRPPAASDAGAPAPGRVVDSAVDRYRGRQIFIVLLALLAPLPWLVRRR